MKSVYVLALSPQQRPLPQVLFLTKMFIENVTHRLSSSRIGVMWFDTIRGDENWYDTMLSRRYRSHFQICYSYELLFYVNESSQFKCTKRDSW